MPVPDETCWTVIERAAAGSGTDREAFARSYLPAVRAYLRARWRSSSLRHDREDAVQEVFVECFRSALARTDRHRTPSFRAFLFGVVRNVARRAEKRHARLREVPVGSGLDDAGPPGDEAGLSAAFDRAWATSILDKARALQAERAEESGDGAVSRVELLRLRFEEGVPIREIALRWDRDPAWLHHQYAKARDEYRQALLDVVAFEHSGTPGEIERECHRLIALFD